MSNSKNLHHFNYSSYLIILIRLNIQNISTGVIVSTDMHPKTFVVNKYYDNYI